MKRENSFLIADSFSSRPTNDADRPLIGDASRWRRRALPLPVIFKELVV
jgi:hypothetical protein